MDTILVIFAFTGASLAGFIRVLCREAAEALNRSESLVGRLRSRLGGVARMYRRRLWVPATACALSLVVLWLAGDRRILVGTVFGASLFLVVVYQDAWPRPDVIPVSWSLIYSGSFTLIMIADRFANVALAAVGSIELLRLLAQWVVVVGTVLGVCMTILWTMKVENLQGLEAASVHAGSRSVNTYRGLWALYMLTLFGFFFLAVVIWLGLPLWSSLQRP